MSYTVKRGIMAITFLLQLYHYIFYHMLINESLILKTFADKHGLVWLDEDMLNKQMASIAEPEHQSAWCSRPTDWEVYYNRPYYGKGAAYFTQSNSQM